MNDRRTLADDIGVAKVIARSMHRRADMEFDRYYSRIGHEDAAVLDRVIAGLEWRLEKERPSRAEARAAEWICGFFDTGLTPCTPNDPHVGCI